MCFDLSVLLKKRTAYLLFGFESDWLVLGTCLQKNNESFRFLNDFAAS